MKAQLFKFDQYLFNSMLGEITYKDEVFRLEHQQADLLLLLLNNKHKLVTRDQIAKQIWQGIIVEDNTITKAITRLRKLLKDDAKSPCFIKTIPKNGYQFIANVEEVSLDFEEEPAISPPKKTKAPQLKSHILILMAILIITITAFLLYLHSMQQKKESVITQPSPITYREGHNQNAHLHPDGKQLLFLSNTEKGFSIFHKEIHDATAKELVMANIKYTYPKWLPKGKGFVYSQVNSQGQCEIISTTIESPDKLTVLSTCVSKKSFEVFVNNKTQNLTWQDDSGVWQLNLLSGLRKQLPFDQENVRIQIPSPDYKLWAVLKNNDEQSVLSVYDIDSEELYYTKTLPYQILDFRWAFDSQALYHLGQHPSQQLIKQLFDDTEEIIARTSFGFFDQISDVQNEHTIEFVISTTDADIAQLTNGKETLIVNSTFPDYSASISPNLLSLAFVSKRTGSAQIWLKQADGKFKQLTQFEHGGYVYSSDWSPDNTKLLLRRANKLYIVDISTDQVQLTPLPLNIEDKFAWQWVTKNSIAYINKTTHSLFYFNIYTHGQQVAKTNVGYAQLVNENWYISDINNTTLNKYDFEFKQQQQISQQLNGRLWLINNQNVYVFATNPRALVRINQDGTESVILTGRTVAPLWLKNSGKDSFIYHKVNKHEANIYQLHAN